MERMATLSDGGRITVPVVRAHTAHRDHPDRSIVITAIGHGDRGRSEATGVLGYLALA